MSGCDDAGPDNGPDAGGRRPVVGITTYVERARQGVWDVAAAYLQYDYVQLVTRAGGVPVLLPPPGPGAAPAGEVLARVDALVLAGGRDVDARYYGAEPHPTADPPATDRDQWELALTRAALDDGVPLLGICRGAQVLAVALGGTLVQHVPDLPGARAHKHGPGEFASHTVRTVPGSRVATALGAEAVVSCYHHQAVERLPDGLRATAHAEDGVVEGVEVDGEGFAVGVQWHPEQTLDDLRLVESLVQAAREQEER
ncbi:gamma-glutamyl-gamma-aminobutyrate hydrolase [Nocardioides flavus (ex Wang et al. 2016)]|uniref:Gamma-glutamyl-gamma-aminobutyrate hydrolase n=1 Tax=Nocardioides flavus (ex Wang et al. 2016) TaxID=2058780 RepID=A0ABQ3HIG6_9ACTN|nr:gamma-glutamyl-gamma-aminobutyrate hydrolase family protein [Nocardioides flavus (ex Wang et al. 2016)]GHE17458.1 gamma-glutamyl-gamma-aminobutyrate hydrolase [Nocardioides flavus (ex Wang et al. 2016)]